MKEGIYKDDQIPDALMQELNEVCDQLLAVYHILCDKHSSSVVLSAVAKAHIEFCSHAEAEKVSYIIRQHAKYMLMAVDLHDAKLSEEELLNEERK